MLIFHLKLFMFQTSLGYIKCQSSLWILGHFVLKDFVSDDSTDASQMTTVTFYKMGIISTLNSGSSPRQL